MRVLFKETDLFSIAADNPDFDSALASAIQKANLSGVDLLVMHMIMLGYSQAEIARHMDYSKMAITKAVQRTRKKMEPHLTKELERIRKKGPKPRTLDNDPGEGDYASGEPEEQDPKVPSHEFFRDLDRKSKH